MRLLVSVSLPARTRLVLVLAGWVTSTYISLIYYQHPVLLPQLTFTPDPATGFRRLQAASCAKLLHVPKQPGSPANFLPATAELHNPGAGSRCPVQQTAPA